MTLQQQTVLIKNLQQSGLYEHSIDNFTLFETHISWVILTGSFAYKIKKSIDLGFLDFSTLDKRHHYCEEEIRLNRRFAPELYLEVVTITGSELEPQINGAGPPVEYAVKMVQFDHDKQFDLLLARDELQAHHLDQLARRVAELHQAADVADQDSPFGSPEQVYQPVAENFEQIRPSLTDTADLEQLEHLKNWCNEQHAVLGEQLASRKKNGCIRECHGDMHLANITLYNDRPTLFDCIEFNESLRWIDVISEVAFLFMDLDEHDRSDLGFRFLNGYLQHTGDYQALKVFHYYLVYRAMVRAKVACLQSSQHQQGDNERTRLHEQYKHYMALAETYTQPSPTALVITHGLSGSGKTTISQPLLEHCGMIRVRSDVERKRLFGLTPEQRSDSAIDQDIYSASASQRTYEHLATLADTITKAGFPVIIDATFLKRAQRDSFRELADRLSIPFVILDFDAPEELLRKWIKQRAAEAKDASEADIAVLEHQIASQEPLDKDEYDRVISIDTSQHVDTTDLAKRYHQLIK